MAKLELQIRGFNDTISKMTINGKPLRVNNITNGIRNCIIESKKDTVEIVMYKTHYYSSKAWFWWSLLYFFISIFGIFDIRQDKRCLVVDCRYIISLPQDAKATIKVNSFSDGGRVIELESEAHIEEISNLQYFDTIAQKRHKTMKKVKLALTIVCVVAAILLIAL